MVHDKRDKLLKGRDVAILAAATENHSFAEVAILFSFLKIFYANHVSKVISFIDDWLNLEGGIWV